MRFLIASATLVVAASAWACGGGDSTPTAPTGGGGGGGGSTGTAIAIVGDRGSASFNPNPSTVAQGADFTWRNNETHRIVMNDGSLDTGEIAPGASSRVLTLATNGGNYHCTIHPGMVGSINSSSGMPPPCQGVYCDSSR